MENSSSKVQTTQGSSRYVSASRKVEHFANRTINGSMDLSILKSSRISSQDRDGSGTVIRRKPDSRNGSIQRNFIKNNIKSISEQTKTSEKKSKTLNNSYQKYLRTSVKEFASNTPQKKSIIKTSKGPIHVSITNPRKEVSIEFRAESGGSGVHGGGSQERDTR